METKCSISNIFFYKHADNTLVTITGKIEPGASLSLSDGKVTLPASYQEMDGSFSLQFHLPKQGKIVLKQGSAILFEHSLTWMQRHAICSSLVYNVCSTEIKGKNAIVTGHVKDLNGQRINLAIQTDEGKILQAVTQLKQEKNGHYFWASFPHEKNTRYSLIFSTKDDIRAVRLTFATQLRPSLDKLHRVRAILNRRNISLGIHLLKDKGVKATFRKMEKVMKKSISYDTWFRNHRAGEEELDRQMDENREGPVISLLVPTWNTPLILLQEMLETCEKQTYRHWQLCIADGSDKNNLAKHMLAVHAANESRIRLTYLDCNYGISGNTNKALELATGEYTAMYDHDDFLELDALYEIVKAIQKNEEVDVVYTDEDKYSMKTNLFIDPNLKPDFSIDLLRSHNYITHLFVVKTAILRGVGGFDSTYDGSQDYDVILKCIEKTDKIYHLPKILYHWRSTAGSTAEDPESKMYCYEAGQKAIQAHLERCHIAGSVEMLGKPYYGLYHVHYAVKGTPLVSILIPNHDNLKMLQRCLNSLFTVNTYKHFEVIIIENNSTSKELFAYYEDVQKAHSNVRVVKCNQKSFNYAALNNFGETYARGDFILLLNNDTEMICSDSLYEMVGIAQRGDVGAVGAKLLYGNNTVQHAGVVIGIGGTAGHVFHAIDRNDTGYMMRALINCDYSAVTGACLMTKRKLYEKLSGLDENLAVAWNDIDFCLRLREKKLLVVYNAFSVWHHYESISRGYETTPEKQKRFEKESEYFRNRWMPLIQAGDPYYNANFDPTYTPFQLR